MREFRKNREKISIRFEEIVRSYQKSFTNIKRNFQENFEEIHRKIQKENKCRKY